MSNDKAERERGGALEVLLKPFRDPDSKIGRGISLGIATLIVLTLIAVVVETLPGLSPQVVRGLERFEYFVVAVFTVEYLLRLVAAGWTTRYVLSFWGVIDLLAVLPFYLGLAMDLRGLRGFRLLRLFRILKLGRYNEAFERLRGAVREVGAEITVFFAMAVVVIYLCGVFVYYLEHDAQPDKFRSALDGFWWAIATMTTVGYGDIFPVTPLGRLFTAVILIVGLGVVAVPTGLIAAALTQQKKGREADQQED